MPQGNDPAKTMEAMDNLAQSFRKSAGEAAESAIRQTETLSREQQLAKALDKAMKTPEAEKEPKKLKEAMQALAKMTAQSAEENKSLSNCLPGGLKDACGKGELSEKQLEELSKNLSEGVEGEEAEVARLADAGLVDADDLEALQGGRRRTRRDGTCRGPLQMSGRRCRATKRTLPLFFPGSTTIRAS